MKLDAVLQARSLKPWHVAVALFAVALIVLATVLVPAWNELATIGNQSVETSRHLSDTDRRDHHERFVAGLPVLAETSVAVRALAAAAEESGVELARGEYRITGGEQTDNLLRYEMVFPVQATYPKIRRFVALAMAALPYAAVDSVTFERRQALDALVHARIKFTLFLRKAGS